MIMLAEAHLSLIVTGPVAVGLAILGGVYWRRLGRASVPRPRRRVRRCGLLIGAVAVLAGVCAVSVVDPETHPTRYLLAWAAVAALVLPGVVVALADVALTVRHHQRSLERRATRDAHRIRMAAASSRRPRGDSEGGA